MSVATMPCECRGGSCVPGDRSRAELKSQGRYEKDIDTEREKMSKKKERSTLLEPEERLLETGKDLGDNSHEQAHGERPSFVPAMLAITR